MTQGVSSPTLDCCRSTVLVSQKLFPTMIKHCLNAFDSLAKIQIHHIINTFTRLNEVNSPIYSLVCESLSAQCDCRPRWAKVNGTTIMLRNLPQTWTSHVVDLESGERKRCLEEWTVWKLLVNCSITSSRCHNYLALVFKRLTARGEFGRTNRLNRYAVSFEKVC